MTTGEDRKGNRHFPQDPEIPELLGLKKNKKNSPPKGQHTDFERRSADPSFESLQGPQIQGSNKTTSFVKC